jgi:hypothetical protein
MIYSETGAIRASGLRSRPTRPPGDGRAHQEP